MLHRRVDMLELRIAVWMGTAFLRLAVALQAIPALFQQIAYRPATDAMPLASQCFGQFEVRPVSARPTPSTPVRSI
jgi:hypothetical protein